MYTYYLKQRHNIDNKLSSNGFYLWPRYLHIFIDLIKTTTQKMLPTLRQTLRHSSRKSNHLLFGKCRTNTTMFKHGPAWSVKDLLEYEEHISVFDKIEDLFDLSGLSVADKAVVGQDVHKILCFSQHVETAYQVLDRVHKVPDCTPLRPDEISEESVGATVLENCEWKTGNYFYASQNSSSQKN